ncbi:MAG TPA: cellulose biosynthesis protein BcsG [Thiobacillus sp.]
MNPWWSLYFGMVALLALAGWLTLRPEYMFALALLQFPRLPAKWSRLRLIASTLAAVALLYWQSSLPSVPVIVDKIKALSGFSLAYWAELLTRLDAGKWLVGLMAALAVYLLISNRLRVSVLALLLLGFSSVFTGGHAEINDADVNATLMQDVEDYYHAEAGRQVMFDRKSAGKQDVLIVQVCSMGWADLTRFGLDKHPLWGKLDVLMTEFNSGTSYSNPAALRLMRGNCGHTRHEDLYIDADASCYLGEQLAAAGFKTDILMNHTGEYSDFLTEVIKLGRFSNTVTHYSAPQLYKGFSGPAVADDETLLKKWWQERSTSPESHATYYNTISLHDGNHAIGQQKETNSVQDYPVRVKRLLDGLLRVFADMEASGRQVIVVVVGEHGAALGEHAAYHLEGLRETPSPDVTLVPAGIKLIGFKNTSHQTVRYLTSYPELTTVLGQALSGHPLAPPHAGDAKFMAENQGKQVFGVAGSLYLRDETGKWARMGDWE